jgi:cytochrome d ubiquinol oxidase subunit I
MAGVGAFYLLSGKFENYGRAFVRAGVIVGTVAAMLQMFPTGDAQGKLIAENQPPTLAGMEGLFRTEKGAPLAILGQPDVPNLRLDNPIILPNVLSFLTYRKWQARVKGLDSFAKDEWPDQVEMLYYCYHVMVGLGTVFIGEMVVAAFLLWQGLLYRSRWMLWILMISVPLPYIANIAGWLTAEFGRQPWLIYGLMRTEAGVSPRVGGGNVLFSLLGFMGMYAILSILFIVLVYRVIEEGPESDAIELSLAESH